MIREVITRYGKRGFQMNTIAERIKFAMKAKNKKQVDIVKDTGISKGAFSSYLSGQYNPKADKMEQHLFRVSS